MRGFVDQGLIIGPRGNTQKRMERETDCKIAIRGKGSVKEGARRGPKAIDEDDDLHVYISGETEENVEKVRTVLQGDIYYLRTDEVPFLNAREITLGQGCLNSHPSGFKFL